MKLSSIHVKSLAINASNISTTTINGQEHYVIRGAVPIVDDIVMNGGLYPAEEINNSYQTMEGKLMPLPHPMVDGKYVSANDPRAINSYHVGAWAQNVSKSGDQVVMDVYINKAVAETKPDGKRLINRLDEMIAGTNTDPIHLSTGLLTNKERKSGESKQKKYSWIARNMQFDHIAILLDEPGAGTPEEGVGMFVNADGQEGEVETASLVDAANSLKDGLLNKVKFFLTHNSDASFDEIYQMLREAIRAPSGSDVYRYVVTVWPDKFIFEEGNKLFQQKYLIDDSTVTLVGDPVEVVRKPTEYEVKTNGENDPMKELIINALQAAGKPTDGKSDAELMDAYNQLAAEKAAAKKEGGDEIDPASGKPKKKEQASNSEEAPAWFKPFADDLAAVKSGIAANSDKEKGEKRAAVKAKFGLDDLAVNALDGAALDGLFAQCQTSTGLNGAFRPVNNNDSFSEMPE
ncbi:DUF2213 domain-containing protein [Klebsiella pneumoniae]|uniref:DUF2213 domain-containing protein n=1 Tax=Klebsiella pneumoniae TaxID=573 RepID=UPI0019581062|nr:DUF2213 domain-containing protein [Klebsiella pneumoniae]QRS32895.1 DUF2213 domain-containing protein [Klebsiella pneumoniae]HBV6231348.1 DUF2213 domain-containing protein [Klebsiella pneumoniae]